MRAHKKQGYGLSPNDFSTLILEQGQGCKVFMDHESEKQQKLSTSLYRNVMRLIGVFIIKFCFTYRTGLIVVSMRGSRHSSSATGRESRYTLLTMMMASVLLDFFSPEWSSMTSFVNDSPHPSITSIRHSSMPSFISPEAMWERSVTL